MNSHTDTTQVSADAAKANTHTSFLLRKIWLPRALYSALPFFYVAAAICSFFATIYIENWFWVLPHYVLFSVACLHMGISVAGKRHRAQQAAI